MDFIESEVFRGRDVGGHLTQPCPWADEETEARSDHEMAGPNPRQRLEPDVPYGLCLCALGLLGIGNMVGSRAAKNLNFPRSQTEEKAFKNKLFEVVRKNNFCSVSASGQHDQFCV